MEREIEALAHNFMCKVLDSYTAVGYDVPWADYLDKVLEITNKTIQEWKKEEIEQRNLLDFFVQFFFDLGIDMCRDMWYNRGVVERAGDGGRGPISRPGKHMQIFLCIQRHMAKFLCIP